MASSVSRFLPKQVPTDVWSLREKLALACAVKRSGDNNWVSVSRAIRPYGEPNRSFADQSKSFGEPSRPYDWFSQKNCALQYSDLLEKVETPKRKRGERETSSAESPGDVIIRKLTIERIEELKRIVQEEELRYKRLKRDVEDVLSGRADDRLDEMLDEIEREKKAALEAEKKWAEELAARDQAKQRNRKVAPGIKVKAEPGESPQPSPADVMSMGEDDGQSQTSETPAKTAAVTGAQSPGGVQSTPVIKQEDTPLITDDIKEESPEVDIATTEIKAETKGIAEVEDVKPAMKEQVEPKEKSEHLQTTARTDGTETTGSESGQESFKEGKIDKKKSVVSDNEKKPTVTEKLPETDGKKTVSSEQESNEKDLVVDKDLEKRVTENRTTDISGDTSSTTEAMITTKEVKQETTDKEKEILVQVIEDKEIKDSEPAAPTAAAPTAAASVKEHEDQPLSPASSVMSNDTDGGGTVVSRGRGRRRQGGKSKGGRRSLRTTRGRSIVEEEKSKESEASSRAESTDDEAGDTALPESDDMTPNMTGRQHQISFNDSVPNSPASITPGDTEDEKMFKLWKKSIMLVWRAAANHKYTNVFSHPVKEEIAPGYHSIVHRPLDLATIKKNIESGVIRTTVEFQRDMMQMFTNAIMYNNSDHDVCHMATEMYDDVMKHIEQYVHTQILVQGGDTKLLRPSRRSEAHSDKEDDPKRKGTDQDGGKAKKRKT